MATSLTNDPARNTFTATPGWRPRPLAQRTREDRVAALIADPTFNPGQPAAAGTAAMPVMESVMGTGQLPPVIGPGAVAMPQPAQPSRREATPAPAPSPLLASPSGLAALVTGNRDAIAAERDFTRNIAPNLPRADLPDEVNASRQAYMDQLVATRAGMAPSQNVRDLLAAPPDLSMDAAGRPVLRQNAASVAAAVSGRTNQAMDSARVAELAQGYADSQTPQPRPGSLTLPSGRVIEGITDPTGNFRVIEPDRPARENLSDVGRLIAERDAAVAADRFDVAQIYDDRIRRMTSEGQAGGAPTTITVAGVPITIGGAPGAPAMPAPAAPSAARPTPPATPAPAPAQNFTPGQRVRQGNTVYQFDGTNWNPVAQ